MAVWCGRADQRILACFVLLAGAGACTHDLSADTVYIDARAADANSSRDGALGLEDSSISGEDVTQDASLSWRERVGVVLDGESLTGYFEQNGGVPRYSVDIYAVAIKDRPGGLAYRYFDVNSGGFSQAFWPASTIKVMACLSALTQVKKWGFTGQATVQWSGYSGTVRGIVERAVRVSSNADYDRCLQIAGHDYVNGEWLSEENGFPTTVLKASYARLGVINVPAFSLTEGAQSKNVSARDGRGAYACDRGGNNCTTPYELLEAMRRLHLAGELSERERFDIHEADRAALAEASCGATVSYFKDAAMRVLGAQTQVCNKAGWVPGNDYLDHALVVAPNGMRFLLAAAVPDGNGPVSELDMIGEHVAAFFAKGAQEGDFWLQPDFGEQARLVRDAQGLHAVGGASIRVFAEGVKVAEGSSPLNVDEDDLLGRWLTLEVDDPSGELIGVRHAELVGRQP